MTSNVGYMSSKMGLMTARFCLATQAFVTSDEVWIIYHTFRAAYLGFYAIDLTFASVYGGIETYQFPRHFRPGQCPIVDAWVNIMGHLAWGP